MATEYGYGKIPADSSLILHLDAANPLSYPGSGTTWFDLSGNGYNGTIVGPTFSTLNGGCFYFLNTQYISINGSNVAAFTPNNITVCFWGRPIFTPSIYHTYVAKWGSANSYIMNGSGGGGNISTFNWDLNNEALNFNVAGPDYSRNAWFHGAATYDRVLGKGYFNGILTNSGSYTGALNSSTSQNLVLGTNPGGPSGRTLLGYMAMVSVYNRALSDEEILKIYNAQKARFGVQ